MDRSVVPDPEAPEPAEEDGARAKKEEAGEASAEDQGLFNTRRGGESALEAIARRFQGDLPRKLPDLWRFIIGPLSPQPTPEQPVPQPAAPLALVEALSTLRVLGPALEPAAVQSIVLPLIPYVCHYSRHPNWAVRRAASGCLASLSIAHTSALLPPLLRVLLPLAGNMTEEGARRETVRVLQELAAALGDKLVPYCCLLLVPLMQRMSDPSAPVRVLATRAFGTLVPLLPLAMGKPLPDGLDQEQRQKAEASHRAASYLLHLSPCGIAQ